MHYALVTGSKGSRRSEAMLELSERLSRLAVPVAGYVQLSRQGPGGTSSIDLLRIGRHEVLPLAWTATGSSSPEVCSFVFAPAAFEAAARWIEEDGPRARVLFLDGFGKLELGRKGHRKAVERALALDDVVSVLSVRDDHLVYAVMELGLEEPVAAIDASEDDVARNRFAMRLARVSAGTQ